MKRRAKNLGARDRLTLGGRVPWAIGFILVTTAIASLCAAYLSRHGTPLMELGSLAPAAVLRGHVWRLATWAFLQSNPFSFIIECLMVYWFGSEVAARWGSRRFLEVFGGAAFLAGVVTSLIALVDPAVRVQEYLGGWPVTSAMVVAWGLTFPDRVVRIYFVLPVRGATMAWFTVGASVVYAIYSGWEHYLPVLLCESLILAYLHRDVLREKLTPPAPRKPPRRSSGAGHLRLIRSRDDEDPPN